MVAKTDAIRTMLVSSNPEKALAGVNAALRFVQQKGRDPIKGLSELFGPLQEHTVFASEGLPLLSLPLFDKALKRSLRKASGSELATVVAVLMKNLSRCEYEAISIAVGELVRRKDTANQLKVSATFKKAGKFVDAGHRMHQESIEDQLVERFFPQFQAKALAAILVGARDDGLSMDGDRLLMLFVPACKGKLQQADAEALARRLVRYVRACMELSMQVLPKDLDTFLQKLLKTAAPEAKRALTAALEPLLRSSKSTQEFVSSVSRKAAKPQLTPKNLLALEAAERWKAMSSQSTKQLRQLLDKLYLKDGYGNVWGGEVITLLAANDYPWLKEWMASTIKKGEHEAVYLRMAIGFALDYLLAGEPGKLADPERAVIDELNDLHARLCGSKLVKRGTKWVWDEVA